MKQAPEKPPYFPFYVGDFLSSRAVAQLTLEQIGAYTLLLCWQWDDPACSLPLDPGVLGYLSRLGDRWSSVGSEILSLCFERRGRRIFNKRLRDERLKYDSKVNAGREGGLSSGRSRRKGIEAESKQTGKQNRTDDQADGQQKRSTRARARSRSREQTTPKPPEGASDADVSPRDPVSVVFEHWCEVMAHPDAKLTDERRAKIRARLDEGYTAFQILEAVDGCRASPFNMGDNEHKRVYDDLTLICRNGSKVEQFRARVSGAPKAQEPGRLPTPEEWERQRREAS